MVEIEGKISDQSVTVLIDLGASLSYINPKIVEKCNLKPEKFQQSWLVQLATGTKRKVIHKLPRTAIKLNDFQTEVNLNILPLGSYDLLIGMDWLEKRKDMMNCWDKTLHCIDEIPHLPPKSEIYFSIDLVLGATPISRAPYWMSPP